MRITRRHLLTGVGVAVAAGSLGGVGSLTDALPGGSWLRRHLGITGEPGTIPAVAPGQVRFVSRYSAARHTQVDCLITTPPGFANHPLPVCLALHGLGSSARGLAELGLPEILAAAVAQGTQPVAIVAPDGAHYWQDDEAGDDPMRMLQQELPTWLAELGLGRPLAVLGISMGGSGALQYGRLSSLRAIAALSPALFTTWSDAQSVHAFPTQAEWAANDPLQHATDLHGTPIGVWCGNADIFYDAAREFATRAHAAMATFEPGDHTDGYWRRVLPAALRFISERLR